MRTSPCSSSDSCRHDDDGKVSIGREFDTRGLLLVEPETHVLREY